MSLITAIGVDLAFANLGLSRVTIDPSTLDIVCLDLQLIRTAPSADKKVTRKSSEDLRRSRELNRALLDYSVGASFAFCEVPHGSQDARAAKALGMAIGVMACTPIEIIEVTAGEVKLAMGSAKGNVKKMTKAQAIDWAFGKWPRAPWLRSHGRAQGHLVNDNEHLADSMAAVVAGVRTPEFQRLLAFYHAAPRLDHHRPSRDSEPKGRIQVAPVPMVKRRVLEE